MSSASLRSAGAARPDRRDYFRRYRQENRDRINARNRECWKRNREKRLAAIRAHREKPEVRERRRAYWRAYYAAHLEKVRAQMRARYHARKKLRKKPDPIESAKRLLAKATALAKQGYSGKLTPRGI